MGKRKVFSKTDISVPQVEHSLDTAGNVVILPEAIPPTNTMVLFKRNASNSRSFDFSRWYNVGIDAITYAYQRQIERFLAGQDGALTITTVASYCKSGARYFLEYCTLRAMAFERDLVLADVDRDLIDGYLAYLSDQSWETVAQRAIYTHTKPILQALGRRGLIAVIDSGEGATFPTNPYPNSNRKVKGETAFSKRERKALTVALRQALQPIWDKDVIVTGTLLGLAVLAVALHTGRNTTPLLEMDRSCLHPHPKDNTVFLVLWKRRGYNTSKVALRSESDSVRVLESTPSVRTNIERLIRRVMDLTEPLQEEAPDDLKGRAWLFRSRARKKIDQITAVSGGTLLGAIHFLVAEYGLTDIDGKPLRVNVSRLRKTFANRIFDLTNGDLASTAAALGNSVLVAERHYLKPDENARRNWKDMGKALVHELLTRSIGATYKETPMGRCADPINGQFAPKREGATCMNFMNCLRCKHYAVTSEDLFKLFSFYFRVLAERSRMDKRRWAREFGHIPRLIDHYIIKEGLQRGIFKASVVETARLRARTAPHPFWSVDLIDRLELTT